MVTVKAMTIMAAVCSFDILLGCLSEGAGVKFGSSISESAYGELNHSVSRILPANTRLCNFFHPQLQIQAVTRADSEKKMYREKRI